MIAALAITGCGSSDRAAGVGEQRAGSVAALALCSDWVAGDEAARQATIEDIRAHVNLQDSPTPTIALTDEQARRVFDRECANDYAAGFRLYKIYARAAGFQSFG